MNAIGYAIPAISLDRDSPPASRCPACQSDIADPVWRTRQNGTFTLGRCRRCQLAFTVPQLSPETMQAFYYNDRYYGTDTIRFGALIERGVAWFRRRRAATICRFVPTGHALDIGCGRGHLLQALRHRGWTVTGLELTETAARHAREGLGLDVKIGPYRSDQFPPASFDAVILWHTLEHLVDPLGVIRGVARMLRPGGLVVIAVPNIESWQARSTRQHWFGLDLPRHYSHFSDGWLRTALEGAGFRLLAVNHFSFEYNLYGWIQSALNGVGLPHNLLYDILRLPSARTIRRPFRTHPVASLVSVLALGVLLIPGCLLIVADSLARRGATIEVFARKEGRA